MEVKRKDAAFVVRRKDQKISVKRKQDINLVLFTFKGTRKRGRLWSYNATFDFYVIKSKKSFFPTKRENIISGL